MSKPFRIIFSSTGLVILIQLMSATSVKAQIINEILKRMEEHYQALSSLKANIKVAQFTSQTAENEVKEGKLIYIPGKGRDAAFRIDWVKPAESLSVINRRYKIYQVNLKTAYVGSVDGVGGGSKPNSVLALLSLSKEQLKATFVINYVGQENVSGGIPTWHLQLIPKSGVAYKNADIWIDKDGMLNQVKQTEKNGDTMTVLLSNLSKNTKINFRDIDVSIPKGVVVKNT